MDSGTVPMELRGWQDCLMDCLQAPRQGGNSQGEKFQGTYCSSFQPGTSQANHFHQKMMAHLNWSCSTPPHLSSLKTPLEVVEMSHFSRHIFLRTVFPS